MQPEYHKGEIEQVSFVMNLGAQSKEESSSSSSLYSSGRYKVTAVAACGPTHTQHRQQHKFRRIVSIIFYEELRCAFWATVDNTGARAQVQLRWRKKEKEKKRRAASSFSSLLFFSEKQSSCFLLPSPSKLSLIYLLDLTGGL